MKVKKFFPRFARTDQRYAPIYTAFALWPSPVHIATAQKCIHTALHTMCPLPSIFLDPPLNTFKKLGN